MFITRLATAKPQDWGAIASCQNLTSYVTSDTQLIFIFKWRKCLPRVMAVKIKRGIEQRVPSHKTVLFHLQRHLVVRHNVRYRNLGLEGPQLGMGIAQWLKELLCKCEDQGSDRRKLCKMPSGHGDPPAVPAWEGRD